MEVKTESLASRITEFNYNPENGITSDAWFVRYEGLFNVDAKNLDDAAKVRLLLCKLNSVPQTIRRLHSSSRAERILICSYSLST